MSITANTMSCVEWSGVRNAAGYGIVCVRADRKISALAHRVAWVKSNGPIPGGLLVCHRCDNRACVNVAHLFLGTAADNSADMKSKGRGRGSNGPKEWVRGERHKLAKLTSEKVIAIREASGTQKVISERFGVPQQYVSKIKRRQAWAWL